MIILAIIGLAVGSFINALVWRVHQQNKGDKSQNLSILKGRSMCPNCRHELAAKDLVPVFSWLALMGKCRYCKAPISWQYPVVELTTPALFVLSYQFWPYTWTPVEAVLFVIWLATLTVLIALFIYDLKWMLLPNRLVFPLISLASVLVFIKLISGEVVLGSSILMLALSVLAIAGLFEGLYIISSGKWIGGGDVKLGIALGLILMQPSKAVLMLFLASLLGTFSALPSYLKNNRKNVRIPFGPWLILAAILVFFFGSSLINWLFNQLLLNA
jgi:leader peptidase (prepilin peptidase)/N-methyltransferase